MEVGEGAILVVGVGGGVFELWLCVEQGLGGVVVIKAVGGGGVYFYFVTRLTLVGVTNGLGFY